MSIDRVPQRVESAELPWVPSPSAGVWRRRLEHQGDPEKGRVTSVVRYEPGATFPEHRHPEGEEILVLEGVFVDEHGTYPASTYLLNPPGSSHAPRTAVGCSLFVKLRQYSASETVCVRSDQLPWRTHPRDDRAYEKLLYRGGGFETKLVRFEPEFAGPEVELSLGEEIFVVAGGYRDEHGHHPAGTWLRYPPGARHRPSSSEGCVLWVKKPN